MARPEGEHFTQRNHFPERQTDTRVAGLLSPERGARRGMERQRGCRAHIKAGREDVAPSAVGDISGTPPSQHLLPCPRASARAGRPARSIHPVTWGPSLKVQWLGLCVSNAGALGSIFGQGTRSHMFQLRPSADKSNF